MFYSLRRSVEIVDQEFKKYLVRPRFGSCRQKAGDSFERLTLLYNLPRHRWDTHKTGAVHVAEEPLQQSSVRMYSSGGNGFVFFHQRVARSRRTRGPLAHPLEVTSAVVQYRVQCAPET